MESLPLMPGYIFHDPTVQDYKLSHKLDFSNGFRVIRDCNTGIGGRPIDAASVAYTVDSGLVTQYDPSVTYGCVEKSKYQQFIPHYALYAQKCLCFKAFFRQGVFNSPDEHFRIHHVNIVYFLEDDTLSVIEPPVDNAGYQQGKLVRRGKIVKNAAGEFFHWKDFNIGIDICIYGVVYHIIDCDLFAKEFLNSQGIDVGDKEKPPVDPYIQLRTSKYKTPVRMTQVADDPRRRFLEYDKMVLSFTATSKEDVYQIMYFLTDDTIAIREILKPNSGKDPVAMILKRMKVPKDWKNLPSSYPGIYMEYGDNEVIEYYTPKDLKIGDTIFIFGRPFFLHSCDDFTKKYYLNMLGVTQLENIPLPVKESTQLPKYIPPPHIKFGSPEDTYTTCFSFIPKPPPRNVIRQLANFPNKLRYSMQMDAVHPEDKNRDFILEYNLSDGKIFITEFRKRNSGRLEGCFLSSSLVPKPGTGRDNPEYYTPQDFFIGARINIFNHYFIINGTDLFVYRYIEANPEKFCQDVKNNIRNYFVKQGVLQDDIDEQTKKLQYSEYSKTDSNKLIDNQSTDQNNVENCIYRINTEANRTHVREKK